MWKSFFMARSICSTGHVKQDINPARFRCIFSMLCRVWNKGIATKYVDIVFFLHEYMPIRRLFYYNKLHLKCYFWMVSIFYELIWYAFEEKLLHNYEVISYDDSDLLFKPASQALHFNGFFSSWTDSICSFKLTFGAKLLLQMLHLNGFFQSWTVSICTFKDL